MAAYSLLISLLVCVSLTTAVQSKRPAASLVPEFQPATCPKFEEKSCTFATCYSDTAGHLGKFTGYKLAAGRNGEGVVLDGVPAGGLLADPEAANQGDCCWKCASTLGCAYWQWIPHLQTRCYLATSQLEQKCETPQGAVEAQTMGTKRNQVLIGGRCDPAMEMSRMDPHYIGAYGTPFDFNSAPGQSVCLVTGRNLHINGKLTGYTLPAFRSVDASEKTKSTDDASEETKSANDASEETRSAGDVSEERKSADEIDGLDEYLLRLPSRKTWIRELGLIWSVGGVEHQLRLAARNGTQQERGSGFLASARVDGKSVPRLRGGESFSTDGGLTLTFLGQEGGKKTKTAEADLYNIRIGAILDVDVRLRVAHPLLQTPDDAQAHINLGISDVDTDNLHGVLGQLFQEGHEDRAETFREIAARLNGPIVADGVSGRGFLDGTPEEYISSGLLEPDCAFSTYEAPKPEVQVAAE